VGPAFTAGTGTTGAIVDTIVDNTTTSHVVIKFYVEDDVIAIMSKDATFTPQSAIPGWGSGQQVKPGMTMSTGSASYLFQGTATDAQLLDGIDSTGFLSSTSNDTTSGTLGILNDTGLSVGVDQDLRVSVNLNDVTIRNATSGGNLYFGTNVAGNTTPTLTIFGANGTVSGNQINANYADVAERFEADSIYDAGTVVELGGSAEITKVSAELSDTVFGVISTRAAYLMNSQAGTDATHPPVAMTGRVPVNTVGVVRKGDRLVSAGNGLARAAKAGEATAFNVIGRALKDKLDEAEGTVEAIVTIK
jgi:hypothetical protein